MWPLLAALGPRILIPSFFLGPKLVNMDNNVEIAQTVALTALFISFAVTLFTEHAWLSLIPGVAAWAYWNMLRNPSKQEVYRYTDWAITTPIILVAILHANGASLHTILGIVALDLIMIGTGYLGVTQTDKEKKNALFILGCLAFLPILYVLFHQNKTKAAIYLTLLLWSLYPIVWYADEINVIKKETTAIIYSIMDVIAKVGVVHFLVK